MKKKGFTLVELLVVIAIIALLMGILMPALAKVRQIAYRMICGTNLSGVGKAMLLYSNDYDERYPKGGLRGSVWSCDGHITDWKNPDFFSAFRGTNPPTATITSCFYLLIKYSDVQPKQFVCKGDIGTKVFKVSDGLPPIPQGGARELKDFWDFGQYDDVIGESQPGKFCTYSLQHPFLVTNPNQESTSTMISFAASPVKPPDTPLCADRNPYIDKNSFDWLDGIKSGELPTKWDTSIDPPRLLDVDKTGNSACHQREGQNVMFNDAHVTFAKYPNVGIDNDNIWKAWPGTDVTQLDMQVGKSPYVGSPDEIKACSDDPRLEPKSERDAVLVNESNRTGE